MPNLIAHTLSSVTLGIPSMHESLTMFPLLVGDGVDQSPFYLTLDQALTDHWTEVTEVSDQGSVPNLLVVNKGEKPVFILDGEELVGAKQNRVVNLSILVPAQSELTIPVSCVEAGRWRARSRAFSSAPRTQYAAGRAMRMRQVTESMQMSRARTSDQAAVWADIAEKSARMGAVLAEWRDGGDLCRPREVRGELPQSALSVRAAVRGALPDRRSRRRLRSVRSCRHLAAAVAEVGAQRGDGRDR